MSRILWSYLLFVAVILFECAESNNEREQKYGRTPLGDEIDKASMKLLQAEYNEAADKNLVSSPLGVFTLLSLYAAGAQRSPLSDEIVEALGAANYAELLKSYGSLNKELSKMDASYFVMANKMYVSNDYSLNQNFADTATRSFCSEVESIDFTDNNAAVAKINQWAEEKTRNNLKNPVPEDVIDVDTVAALFNAIYFQGHWHVPFNASETRDIDFYIDRSTTVKKQAMHLTRSFYYTESKKLGARLLELPYKEDDFRMVVILPKTREGLSKVIEKVAIHGVLEDISRLEESEGDIELSLPKFSIESEFDLNKILPKIGVSKIFNEGASGIVEGRAVRVSKAFQKTFIKIDEEGATAAAVSGGGFVFLKYVEKINFKVDRPYMFCILKRDKIIFAGTMAH